MKFGIFVMTIGISLITQGSIIVMANFARGGTFMGWLSGILLITLGATLSYKGLIQAIKRMRVMA